MKGPTGPGPTGPDPGGVIDVNPVMVKEALALMGQCERVFRLPLCETDDAKLAQMKKTLAALGLV